MPSADVLALNPTLVGLEASTRAPKRPNGARSQRGKGAPQNGAQALTASTVGSSFQARLDKAAQNGWHAIESSDAVRYRWRQNGGAVGPWGSYEECTAWGATCCPVRTKR